MQQTGDRSSAAHSSLHKSWTDSFSCPHPCCRSAVKKEQVAAGVTAAAAAVLANPLAAQAAATPSLNNLIGSVVAGGLVLAAIAGAITAVS